MPILRKLLLADIEFSKLKRIRRLTVFLETHRKNTRSETEKNGPRQSDVTSTTNAARIVSSIENWLTFEYFGDLDFRFGQKLNTLRAARVRRLSEPGFDFCLTNAAWCGIL
jgi:hypothetical protein